MKKIILLISLLVLISINIDAKGYNYNQYMRYRSKSNTTKIHKTKGKFVIMDKSVKKSNRYVNFNSQRLLNKQTKN